MSTDPLEPMREASEEIRDIIKAVLEIESENLSKEKPRYVVEEIKKRIEEIII